MKTIFFIGGGTMCRAFLTGLDVSHWKIIVCEVSVQQQNILKEKYNHIHVVDSFEKVKESDVIFFAIKPQTVPGVLDILHYFDFSNKIVMTIMAGVNLSTLKSKLKGSGIKFIRAMPNLALLVGNGVTGVYAEDKGTSGVIQEILGKVSELYYFDSEHFIDEVTAISGSGPAYFFAFMEALALAAEGMGIPSSIATRMVIGTALGSSLLAHQNPDGLHSLRESVTSKGGTTEAALEQFEQSNLNKIVNEAATAALNRARQLAGESKL